MDQIGETLADTSTVTYHGILTKADLEALYAASHLAVFPSFIEAFSLAPMEAMAVGLPVIFTERASGRELITEGETGRLVDPGDVEGVASTLIEMIQMPAEARHALALRGQKHIQDNFSIDRLIDENEALMYRLLGRIPAG
jgi:glycosyltransferase involved in cell wall biosynthesis